MDDHILDSLRYALTMLNPQQSSVPTFNVPIIPPLTARAVVPTVSVAPSVNAGTTLGVNFVAANWEEEIIPPKVTYAFLAMISE